MKILAVESSAMVAAVAVAEEDRLMGEFLLDHKKTHSQQLMPLVEDILKNLDLELSDIDLFGVSKGPGSFTGLRIGIATVKALAQATRRPIVGVPTLDGLAYNLAYNSGIICPIMDARRDQVYTSIYRFEDGLQRLDDYMGIPVHKLMDRLHAYDEPVIFNGDGVPVYWDRIKENLGDRAIKAPVHSLKQRASSIASLGLKYAKLSNTESYIELKPFYLRKSQAERKLAQKG